MNVIPICFAADNNYFPFMAVAIQSIIENASKERAYKIIVLYTDISAEYRARLAGHIKTYDNFKIEYINVSDNVKDYSFDNTPLSRETYYRLLIPYILGNYERVIYLDSDLVCLEDIANILTVDPPDVMIEGVRDILGTLAYKSRQKDALQLGLKNAQDYFNAGILVFNTAVFAKTISQDELCGKAALNLRWADQDVLNIVCEGKVHFLEMSWNVASDKDLLLEHPFDREYAAARRQPYIIHYCGEKPWKLFCVTQRGRFFWQYARNTPFFDLLYPTLIELVTAPLTEPDLRQYIFNDIRNGRKYGLLFVVKSIGNPPAMPGDSYSLTFPGI